jgi:hypothetical protein
VVCITLFIERSSAGSQITGAAERYNKRPAPNTGLRDRKKATNYEIGSILATWIVLLFMSSLPVTFTCLPT